MSSGYPRRDEFLEKVFQARIPLRFTLNPRVLREWWWSRSPAKPGAELLEMTQQLFEPFVRLVPRCHCLALLLSDVWRRVIGSHPAFLLHVSQHDRDRVRTVHRHLWFREARTRQPLPLTIPIGVLFDLYAPRHVPTAGLVADAIPWTLEVQLSPVAHANEISIPLGPTDPSPLAPDWSTADRALPITGLAGWWEARYGDPDAEPGPPQQRNPFHSPPPHQPDAGSLAPVGQAPTTADPTPSISSPRPSQRRPTGAHQAFAHEPGPGGAAHKPGSVQTTPSATSTASTSAPSPYPSASPSFSALAPFTPATLTIQDLETEQFGPQSLDGTRFAVPALFKTTFLQFVRWFFDQIKETCDIAYATPQPFTRLTLLQKQSLLTSILELRTRDYLSLVLKIRGFPQTTRKKVLRGIPIRVYLPFSTAVERATPTARARPSAGVAQGKAASSTLASPSYRALSVPTAPHSFQAQSSTPNEVAYYAASPDKFGYVAPSGRSQPFLPAAPYVQVSAKPVRRVLKAALASGTSLLLAPSDVKFARKKKKSKGAQSEVVVLNTLSDVLTATFPQLSGHLSGAGDTTTHTSAQEPAVLPLLHGAPAPLNLPVYDLWNLAASLDNFLHIVLIYAPSSPEQHESS